MKKFWKEWGITLEEFGYFIGALAVISIPFTLSILGTLIEAVLL